jgi:tetratricopeptide (TPR) repeat protein
LKRLLLTALISVAFAFPALAADGVVARVFSLQGSATVVRSGKTVQLLEGGDILAGDEIVIGEPGRAALELTDGSYVRLPAGAKMRFPAKQDQVDLIEGSLHFLSHSEQHPTVVTEHVTAAIRGTEFTVTTDKSGSSISLMSGSVDGTSKTGRVSLASGQGASFRPGRAPEVYTLVSSDRSVQWSMFVPYLGAEPVLDSDPVLSEALKLSRAGKISAALKALPAAKGVCDPAEVLRARLLITAGTPNEGAKLLEHCVVSKSKGPVHGLAESTLALVRLSQGDLVAAENLSQHALEESPGSASARLARSFVLQQKGDLDGALAVVHQGAGAGDPELLARQAEVTFMFGEVPEARAMLESIPNRSWYAEAVYGFVLMGDRSFDEARSAFEKAAREEPAAGLPRMGLGIVKFNQGDLSEARKDFERAAVLEPNRSIYRSYLGKDYFEEDNYDPAYPEYARAIELDPNDPTPYLYRSFMKLADNNLIGSIEDLDTARQLSSRRDVYRSSFLLDEDSAVQAASIGRVYNELGYRERGRVEAITAIVDDYQNASAHRLLSQTQEDIYLADTIASERRIANLFAPLSINVVDAIGTSVTLNEYSQLLEEDGWRTGSNTFYDSKAETIKTGVLSAHKFGNYALGLSADGLAQNGIADDPRTSAGTVGVSFQAQPDWANRFLFEARGVSSGQSQPDDTADVLEGDVSAAYLHRFSPNRVLLTNSTYTRDRTSLHTPTNVNNPASYLPVEVTTIFDGQSETEQVEASLDRRDRFFETSVVNEVQFVSDDGPLQSFITYRNVANTLSQQDSSQMPYEFADGTTIEIPFGSSQGSNLAANSGSYLGDLEVADGLHINFGVEYDWVQFAPLYELPPFVANDLTQSLWSPKAGIIYNPDETLIFRTGYGESLAKGTLIDLVSIEPTTIGGIIQRFNDDPGTQAQTFGVGLDLHPRKSTYFGAEWTRRWLDLLQRSAAYDVTIDFDNSTITPGIATGDSYSTYGQQNFVTAYWYEILTEQVATGLDYRYAEQFTNGDPDYDTRDHRGKAFARYYFEGPWFLNGAGIYRYQSSDGDFDDPAYSDAAWLFNAGIGYRLPTRHGILLLDVNNIFGQDVEINQSSYFNEPLWSDPTVTLVANFNF